MNYFEAYQRSTFVTKTSKTKYCIDVSLNGTYICTIYMHI